MKTTVQFESAEEFARYNGINPQENEARPRLRVYLQGFDEAHILGVVRPVDSTAAVMLHIADNESTKAALALWSLEQEDEFLGDRRLMINTYDNDGEVVDSALYDGVHVLAVEAAEYRFGSVFVVHLGWESSTAHDEEFDAIGQCDVIADVEEGDEVAQAVDEIKLGDLRDAFEIRFVDFDEFERSLFAQFAAALHSEADDTARIAIGLSRALGRPVLSSQIREAFAELDEKIFGRPATK